LGRIIVNGQGHTLYLFEKDRRGHSACSGACATYWPPLVTGGEADRGQRRQAGAAGHDPARRRHQAGDLRRAPRLPLPARRQARSDQG
jgi:hypothetical protein